MIPVGPRFGKPQFLNGRGNWSGAAGRLLHEVYALSFETLYENAFKNFNFGRYKEFDVLAPPQLLAYASNVVFDYVGFVDEDNAILITPALSEESTLLSTIKPFKLSVSFIVIHVSLV